jgi:hypothetical protein
MPIQNPQDRLNRRLNRIRGGRGRTATKIAPAEDESMFHALGRKTLGALGKAGNLLDTIGGTTRTALAGENPLAAAANPLSGEHRVSGLDLLTKYAPGLVGTNDPKKWELGDVGRGLAGFATEVATDPMTYVTLGGSAVLKGGVRGLAHIGIPFTKIGKVVGTGRVGQKIVGAGRAVKNAAAYGNIPGTKRSPGRALAQAFDSRVLETATPEFQRATRARAGAADAAQAAERMQVAKWTTAFHRAHEAGIVNAHDSAAVRRILEGVDAVPPELKQTVNEIHSHLASRQREYTRRGIKAPVLDDIVNYIPRQLSSMATGPRTSGLSPNTFAAVEPSQKARKMFLKGIPGGTDPITRLGRDPVLNDMIEKNVGKIQIARHIKKNYPEIPVSYNRKLKAGEYGPPKPKSRVRALATWLKEGVSKETRQSGIFGNTPLHDILTHRSRVADRLHNVDTVYDVLSQAAQPMRMQSKSQNMVRLDKVFRALKLAPGKIGSGGWIQQIGNRNPALAAEMLRAKSPFAFAKTLHVPRALAEDALRTRKGLRLPAAVGPVMQGIDSLTNVTKAGLTGPFASFHARNRLSGAVKNATEGLLRSPKSELDAGTLLRGGSLPGVEQIPEVANILQSRGLPITNANATDVFRQLAFSHGLSQSHLGEAAARIGGAPEGSSFQSLSSQLPGIGGGFRWKDVAKQAIGATPTTTVNPLKGTVRGGFNATPESSFGPVKAGETLGNYVEGLNRLSPLLDEMRRGVPSAEAARKIKSAQVDYSAKAYTPFERDVLTRVMPFYKFQKGSTVHLAKELASKPGGATAQLMRATNKLRGDQNQPLPEYVGDTAAIPLPGAHADGTRSYLTGLGLMHESPLEFAGGNPLLEAVSRANPLLKGPIEAAFGQSAFQKSAEGGRPLTDMDPLAGRLLANLTGRDEPYRINPLLEHVLANSPLSRALTTAKTLTDRRPSATLVKKALNLGTGLRITDVSPASQEKVLREKLNEEMHALGGRNFNEVYLPESRMKNMSTSELQYVQQLKKMNALLGKKARTRAKTKKQKKVAIPS